MLAAAARRLSAAASSSSSSTRASQLAAALNPQVREAYWCVGGSHLMISAFRSGGAGDEQKCLYDFFFARVVAEVDAREE